MEKWSVLDLKMSELEANYSDIGRETALMKIFYLSR